MKTLLSMRDVLDQLAAEGYVAKGGDEAIVSALASGHEVSNSPWYVRLFVAISAWLAAGLLIAGVEELHVIRGLEQLLVPGLTACALAAGLNRFAPRNAWAAQLALAVSLAGQIAAGVALYFIFDGVAPAALLIILLECALIGLYRSSLHRFLSTLIIGGAALVILLDLDALPWLQVVALTLAAGSVALYSYDTYLRQSGSLDWLAPIRDGITLALLGFLILPLRVDFQEATAHFGLLRWIMVVGLWGLQLLLAWQIVSSLKIRLNARLAPWLVISAVAVLVLASRVPGILGALIVLLLAFWRNNRVWIALAGLFLVFYLGAYYYSLDWTLLSKSLALMGMGAVLLLVRYLVSRLGIQARARTTPPAGK